MGNSTTKPRPQKPRPDFPLFCHRTGRWCKKIRGRHVYFGKIADDPKGVAALELYNSQAPDLHAGRLPRRKQDDGLEIRVLCNQYLTHKRHLLDSSELTERTFSEYHRTCKSLLDALGKSRLVDDLTPSDFETLRAHLAKTLGPVALGNAVGRIRSIFRFGHDQGLLDQPVRYGQSFRTPGQRAIRQARARNGNGLRMFEACELRKILDTAPPVWRAFILLGVNAGYGQSDISNLPLATVNKALATGWLEYPRPKTGIQRRAPLWCETIDAVREALDSRPKPRTAAERDLAFVTATGRRWVRTTSTWAVDDSLGRAFANRLKRLRLKKKGVSFYALRHTFATIAGRSKDEAAIRCIMGHTDGSELGAYTERVDDDRLVAVVEVVHDWLFEVDSAST